MVMVRNWLLRLFGLSDIIIKQALEIDRLQMQCDLYQQLALIDGETIRKLMGINNANSDI